MDMKDLKEFCAMIGTFALVIFIFTMLALGWVS